MWMRDYHIDGLRLDAVHAFIDRSAIPFLEQLSTEVAVLSATLARRLVVIAESDLNDPRVVTPREAGGIGMDAQWSDDFHHALFTVIQDETVGGYYEDFGKLSHLAKALESTFVYDGIYSGHRNRVHGRPTGNISQHRFLGFIQNHDQVGNRAVGDRLHDVVGMERAKIAAAVVLLSPFIPMIFEGEEWAASSPFQYFADHEDPELARLVAEGRRKEFAAFGWNPQLIPNPEKRETFERSKLKWDEVNEGTHGEMLAWYRALIHLRRSTPALNNGEPGNTRVIYDEDAKWFSVQRGNVALHCNLGNVAHRVSVADLEDCRVVLSSDGQAAIDNGELLVPANGAVIAMSAE
jgi:maltooligosyltrehalose trehalohydrolase